MTFRLVFSDEAVSELRKLDNATAKRILDSLERAASRPAHYLERLTGRVDYKLRVGDYRVLAKLDNKEKVVFILSLGHRKNIYR
ncbi:MAG: type II toxin-antitoxin system RelE/ParE family toxin [Candidatus Aenigmatarchaeota archaeon]|nr:MAG: type II toxin-antitoxin system RelE/ParE family toxin [Candidatus Aenigmarchaeota archaeon]